MEGMGFAMSSSEDDDVPVRQALTTGLFLNAAALQADGSYKVIASGQKAALHPSSTLLGKRPTCIIFSELILTGKPYAQCVTAVEPTWLTELVPRFFASSAS